MSYVDVPRHRQLVMALVIISMFSALFVRLYYLQVLTSETYEAQATSVSRRTVLVPPQRGRILDRNGVVLAENRLVGQVSIDKLIFEALIPDPERRFEALGQLASLLNINADELRTAYNDPWAQRLLPVIVATDVDEQTLILIKERDAEFPGVTAAQIPVRVYPLDRVASHILGYVGPIPAGELAIRDGYLPNDQFGRAGVELVFESDLRGTAGELVFEVDRRSQVMSNLPGTEPIAGDDIYLTIDVELQQFTEQALKEALLSAQKNISEDSDENFPAPAGSIVVLDSRDGSILSMASFPDYNPNNFIGGIDKSVWNEIRDPRSYAPLNNRAIQGLYSPGSVFKLVSAMAGLESGIINRGTVIYDDGVYEIEKCEGRCSYQNAGGAGLGWVGLPDSLTRSSDWYYYAIGARIQLELPLGEDQIIQDIAREFGLGSATGVQLPFEQRGFIPSRDTRIERNKENPEAFPNDGWFAGDNTILAIGQGELVVTPLQLAVMYAAFANGGSHYEPNVVGRVTTRTGDLVRELGPRERNVIEFGSYYDDLLTGFRGVTRSRGTAKTAFAAYPQSLLSVAGKTGTAQVDGESIATGLDKEDTAVFVGFGPVNNPKYVVVVLLEESGFGGDAAAPAARAIFEKLIELDAKWAAQAPLIVEPEVEDPV